ncbi:MAG: signal peptide peptidase SppA [Candidatus Marinimicrobia bacterium]|nr:signal peptide peptidase SppA [Candidatus Neomarinimicrobiota bacterium]MBL7023341.1 signal peptide peptidase SppA [Candidatus Neomarinimicrobiota bacterium]MBL7109300.1 signal peptide peptidase SppA [Candidatus Neomarinimicrobiota bacterium]
MITKPRFPKWILWVAGIIIVAMILSYVTDKERFYSGPKIGVIEISSTITSSKEIVEDINYFVDRNDIDAIIIRLDTPGGGVAASQEIYEKVKFVSDRKLKPIIASMGGVAASGGYYIALGCDTIIANPGTATGSIGVIISYPVISELLENFGVGYETIKSADLKDSGSPFRKPTDEDRIYFQSMIDDLNSQFVKAVTEQRNLSIEQVNEVATGQVFSGKQALQLSLIDILGTFEDAIYLIGKLVGFTERPLLIYPPKERIGLFDLLSGYIDISSKINWAYPKPEYRLY